MSKKVVLKCTYSIKKADDPKNICHGCALQVGGYLCVNRDACPDDGTGLNLFFEGSKILDHGHKRTPHP